MVAAQRSYSFARTWLSDPACYPIMGIIVCAISGGSYTMARYASRHPDVQFNKAKREDIFRFEAQDGADWRAHRFTFANGKRNPINQSEMFDPMFERPENQHISR
ncbi:hypothetical protein SDRG_15870 [Saprolegnia diclina VS20]|uniref:Uncharacterized protein n=1 Tax=Saprolegnia diclina (strain VS20) TaxID=1156394 RepID=T0R2M9_SAPDV|nr:hypothetical protein SDRG_15869 [Saprolegnia diclina VS20]XP_008620278.1 hypothetical protein SDRG_15870 [Saprolegnia diclina VS20]EQC26282.1 hypothetical protein SDRG_15869 [Saprolegnia diclina VS20]EQC26283.1 hypothetical protein SDRG_15870 [Saprolegnia diclina VS20]|eukprot:XP_008620277.1 hypothetical protein SDRG_15869 [Saprolegnia diclina VS20]